MAFACKPTPFCWVGVFERWVIGFMPEVHAFWGALRLFCGLAGCTACSIYMLPMHGEADDRTPMDELGLTTSTWGLEWVNGRGCSILAARESS